MPSPYGRAVAAAFFVFALAVSPYAHADTSVVPIGDPYTDTLQLWSNIITTVEALAHDLATSLISNQSQAASSNGEHPQRRLPSDIAQSAAAALATPSNPDNAPTSASQSHTTITSQQPPASNSPTEATSDQTTDSQNVKSAISAPTNATTGALIAPSDTNFVTQSQFNSALSQLGASVRQLLTETNAAPIPQNIAADGNSAYPYAAANAINNLSNVTITNANLTVSEIPALDYLSLSGGSLSGDLSVAGNATTTGTGYFTGNVGIGTSTSQDALSVDGSEYLTDITAPGDTTNRLYANGGSLYWAGSLLGGASTGNWTSDGTNVWRTGGDIGVGTTSPFATVSIVGTGYFTGALTAAGINAVSATTTNATSTTLFSTFGNFTSGLISTLSGTQLTYTAASTTNRSTTLPSIGSACSTML
jgi:hypothetical protein